MNTVESVASYRPAGAMPVRPAYGFMRPPSADSERIGGADPAAAAVSAGALAVLRAALDHVQFGVLVIGSPQTLVFANQAARRECERSQILRLEGDRVRVPQARQLNDFLKALGDARQGRWSLVRLAQGEERMMLSVLPLHAEATGPDSPALVMFGLRGRCRALALEFYARSCGLTSAETRVLGALEEGLTASQIAKRHEVALSTVRTQLASIRLRTGARTIVDLVHTLGSLPPIMPAALGCA